MVSGLIELLGINLFDMVVVEMITRPKTIENSTVEATLEANVRKSNVTDRLPRHGQRP